MPRGGYRPGAGRKGFQEEENLKLRMKIVWEKVDYYLQSENQDECEFRMRIILKLLDKALPNRKSIEAANLEENSFSFMSKEEREEQTKVLLKELAHIIKIRPEFLSDPQIE